MTITSLDERLAKIEDSMHKMSDSFSDGMSRMTRTMEQMAEGFAKIQSNTEEHRIIHQRIDHEHEEREALRVEVTELQRDYHHCCGSGREELQPQHPVKTVIATLLVTMVLLSYVGLILIHSKEFWGMLTNFM